MGGGAGIQGEGGEGEVRRRQEAVGRGQEAERFLPGILNGS